MDEHTLAVLRSEFEAHDGSFLIQLRPRLTWDKAAFSRLIAVMEQCCRDYADNDLLDRWIAQGFWYIPTFVKAWTTHPNFPREHEQAYYDAAYRRLDDLAYWYFWGQSPYIGDAGFDPL